MSLDSVILGYCTAVHGLGLWLPGTNAGVICELSHVVPDTQFIDCDVVGLLNGLGHFSGNALLKTAVSESVNEGVSDDFNDLLFLLAVCVCLKGD